MLPVDAAGGSLGGAYDDEIDAGNGMGGALLTGAMGLAQFLAPLAMKALVPMGL